MRRKVFTILLVACMLLSLSACSNNAGSQTPAAEAPAESGSNGAAAQEKFRVAYLNRDDTDDFLNRLCSLTEGLCAADDSIEFTRYDAASDANTQLTQFEDVLSKGVDLVILSVQDKETAVSKVKECNEKGIPVIALDIALEEGTCDFIYIGSDNYSLAYTEGSYLIEHLPANGRVIYLRFTPGSETSNRRHDGIMDGIEGAGRTDYEILSTMEYPATQEAAMKLMEDLLQVYGNDWDALITHNDKGTYGAISAIEAAGYDPKEKLIVSFDGEDIAMQLIQESKIDMSVMQDIPGMCAKAFELVKLYQSGGTPDSAVYHIPGVALDASNVAEYIN